ncbi:Cytochrome c oxidase subunit 2 [Thalassocella blandensis]|nr:Cytochrome c oxidase subunit 2 [Thalassocella blandensis]
MLSTNTRSLTLLFATSLALSIPALGFADELQFNMTEGVTSVSKEVYGLHMLIFYICCAIGVIVFGAMFYSMFMHRKSRGVEAANFHHSTSLEIVWTAIPFLILILMAIPATTTLKKIYDADDADIDILVTGYQWKWRYEYLGEDVSFFSVLKTPSTQIHNEEDKGKHYLLEVDEPLYIPINKKVRFLVTSSDVIHSWWVPPLAVKRDAIPGYTNAAWTRVEEPGVFRGQCAELCGKDHGFMPIEVHAVSESEFTAWLGKRKEEAAAIREAAKQTLTLEQLLSEGEKVYTKNCAACHQADGKGMPPTFPAIAGSPIADGERPIAEHFNRVLNGGQGMPPFGEQLTPVQAAAVITFQRNAFGNNTGDVVQPIDILKYKQGQ